LEAEADSLVLTYTSTDEESTFMKGQRLLPGVGVSHKAVESQKPLDIPDVQDELGLFWWRDQDTGVVAAKGKFGSCKTRARRTGGVAGRPMALPDNPVERLGIVMADTVSREDRKAFSEIELKLVSYAATAMSGLYQQVYDAQQKAYDAAMRAKKRWGGAMGKVVADVQDKANPFAGLMEDLQESRRLRAKVEKQLCTPQRLKELYELKRYVTPVAGVVYLTGTAMLLIPELATIDALQSFSVPMHKEMSKMLWKNFKKFIVVGGRDIKATLLGKLNSYRPESLTEDESILHRVLIERVLAEVSEVDAKKICPCAVLLRDWFDIILKIMDHSHTIRSADAADKHVISGSPEVAEGEMSAESSAILARAENARKAMFKLGYTSRAIGAFKSGRQKSLERPGEGGGGGGRGSPRSPGGSRGCPTPPCRLSPWNRGARGRSLKSFFFS